MIFALGAIPIAAILPHEKISLQSGVFDAFAAVITDLWHMGWVVQALSLLVGLGAVSGVFAWLGSPSKGYWPRPRMATCHAFFRRQITMACPTTSFGCRARLSP